MMGFMFVGAVLPGYRIGRDTSYSTRDTVAMGTLAGGVFGAALPLVASLVIFGVQFEVGQLSQVLVAAGAAVVTAYLLGAIAGMGGAYVAHRRYGQDGTSPQTPTVVDTEPTETAQWKR